MKLIQKVRKFLKNNNIDYLLVNSTNEFLVEYPELQENARYLLTKFSGSTGDAVISQSKIYLFVDGRYHRQADLEVDKNQVTVVKMKIGESFSGLLSEKLSPDKTLAMVAQKNSQKRLELLKQTLKKKNIDITLIDYDPVIKFSVSKVPALKDNIEKISDKICGISADDKFSKISKNLKNKEAVLITNPEEVSYLCNLRDFSFPYSSKIRGKCIITKDNATLFSGYGKNIGEKFKLKTLKEFENYIKKISGTKTVYVDKNSINAYDYGLICEKALPLKISPLKEMKSIKTPEEIVHYKKCFEKTDKALNATKKIIEETENLSEYDIAQKLEENFYKFGAKSLSFKSIVAKDKNSALAHYSKNSKKEILKEGSLILIDCGAYYEGGYATDITRVFIKGNPSKLQKRIYTTVLKGVLKAFRKKITNTTTGFSLDKTARKILNGIKPEGFEFSHSLGHGIGINVHESPPFLAFSLLAKTPLKPNMCFTIEPGLYNPKHFGIRLENSCYLSKEKNELKIKSFTNMCFEKKLIDFDMLTSTEKKQLKNFKIA